MKKLLTTFFVVFIFGNLMFAQPWMDELNSRKERSELTLKDYQMAFENYWRPYNVERGYWHDSDGKKHKAYGWKQFRRWENFWKDAVDAKTGAFPNTTAKIEFDKYIAKHGKYKSDDANWSFLGTNTTDGGYAGIGRINTIAFHPTNNDIFWIGAPAGGLWKTTDGGNSWTVLTDDNAVLGVSAIVIPSDYDASHTVYIGTGDRDAKDNYSIGVLKSTDDGATWQTTGLSFEPANKNLINAMLKHPTNNNIIFAATNDGLYKTTDAGTTWNKIEDLEYVDIEFQPENPTVMYGSTRNGSIYKSTNSGDTWVNSFSDFGTRRTEIAVSPDDATVVYAVAANSDNGLWGILKSTNSGDSYTKIFDSQNLLGWVADGSDYRGQGWYDLAIAADPSNANIVFVGGVNTWKTTDGGQNWTIANHWTGDGVQAVHADKHYLIYRNTDNALFEGNDGGIYSTMNNGTSWNHHTNGIGISQMYGLSTAQTVSNMTILGLQDNGTKLQDGSNWSDVMGGDGMKCIIDYTNENVQYGSYYYGRIYRTKNKWGSSSDISPSGKGNWVTPYVLDPVDHNTIYVGFDKLWKSTNQGNTYTNIGEFSDKLNQIAISHSDPNYIYCSDDNNLYKTKNGGTNWTTISGGLPSSSTVTYIEVKYNDPKTVWVTLSGFNSDAVYKTTDGGVNWENISTGLPNIPAKCIIQNKLETGQEQLYVGTYLGVYIKEGDANWTLFSNNLPNVVVSEFDIYYDNSNPANSRLRASTYGRGMWETSLKLTGAYAPSVMTTQITDITEVSAKLSGKIENDFGANITQSGVVIGPSSNPVVGGFGVTEISTSPVVTTGDFSVNATGLIPGTTYHCRAFAQNTNGIGYGADKILKTKCTPVNSFPWENGLESAGEMPNCFTMENITETVDWKFIKNSTFLPNTPHSGEYFSNINSLKLAKTKLIIPIFDISSLENPSLSFWYCITKKFSKNDVLNIYYKNKDITDWTKITSFDNYTTEWTLAQINLPNPAEQYQIAFEADLKKGKGISLDDLKISSYLGIEDNSDIKMSIYPNPSTGIVYLNIRDRGDNAVVNVFDYSGKILKKQNLTNNTSTLDLSDYANGIYIIQVNTNSGSYSKKIIIK